MQNAKPDGKRIKRTTLTNAQRSARYKVKIKVTGRSLDISAITPQFDGTTGETYIQIITNIPLAASVYRLEVDRAKTIVNELAGALGFCENLAQLVQAVGVGEVTIQPPSGEPGKIAGESAA